jgi:hypothetical protein
MSTASGRRKAVSRRRTPDRRSIDKERKTLIDALRMQARTRAAANRVSRVEPSDPKQTLEWKAADYLERDS